MSAVDQLNDEIRQIVWEGDAETVVRMLELTRNLNTQIELENHALWAFVRADDAFEIAVEEAVTHDDLQRCDVLLDAVIAAREALRQYERPAPSYQDDLSTGPDVAL